FTRRVLSGQQWFFPDSHRKTLLQYEPPWQRQCERALLMVIVGAFRCRLRWYGPLLDLRFGLPVQPVDATQALNLSAGVSKPQSGHGPQHQKLTCAAHSSMTTQAQNRTPTQIASLGIPIAMARARVALERKRPHPAAASLSHALFSEQSRASKQG